MPKLNKFQTANDFSLLNEVLHFNESEI